MSVEVKNLSKHFGQFRAVDQINLQVRSGELLALLGPSGSGKTTLLRMIGGLEFPDQDHGQVFLHGKDVTEQPAGQRQIGFVFQHYALFRHLSVFENIAFGLRVRRRSLRPRESEIRKKVTDLLKLVQLEGLEGHYPSQISGGQKQRVAFARALAVDPKVLLLDEPFGALDAKVRKELRRWIRRLHQEIQVTSIFVTHDQDEALEVAGRVVVMNEGKIEQVGTPTEVYENPRNPFVYNFLGRVVALRGRIRQGQLILGRTSEHLTDYKTVVNAGATIFARPQDIEISFSPNGSLSVRALVRDVNLAGPLVYLELERMDDGTTVEVEVPATDKHALSARLGSQIYLVLKRYQVFVEDYSI